MFQACVGIPLLLLALCIAWYYAFIMPHYDRLMTQLDQKWGFVLQEGHNYTAPVWMGEFGAGQRGNYWINFIRYLAERDVDWAYWPLNPDKQTAGWFDDWGQWHTSDMTWYEDTYSILDQDYMTVRDPWRILDLHAIMVSPAVPVLNTRPCQRSVLG